MLPGPTELPWQLDTSQQPPNVCQAVIYPLLDRWLLACLGPAAQPHLHSQLLSPFASSWSRPDSPSLSAFLTHHVSPSSQCRWLRSILALALPGEMAKVKLLHGSVPRFPPLSLGSDNGWQIFVVRITAGVLGTL